VICGLNDTVKAGGSVINASLQTQFQDGLVLVQSNICLSTRLSCLHIHADSFVKAAQVLGALHNIPYNALLDFAVCFPVKSNT